MRDSRMCFVSNVERTWSWSTRRTQYRVDALGGAIHNAEATTVARTVELLTSSKAVWLSCEVHVRSVGPP